MDFTSKEVEVIFCSDFANVLYIEYILNYEDMYQFLHNKSKGVTKSHQLI